MPYAVDRPKDGIYAIEQALGIDRTSNEALQPVISAGGIRPLGNAGWCESLEARQVNTGEIINDQLLPLLCSTASPVFVQQQDRTGLGLQRTTDSSGVFLGSYLWNLRNPAAPRRFLAPFYTYNEDPASLAFTRRVPRQCLIPGFGAALGEASLSFAKAPYLAAGYLADGRPTNIAPASTPFGFTASATGTGGDWAAGTYTVWVIWFAITEYGKAAFAAQAQDVTLVAGNNIAVVLNTLYNAAEKPALVVPEVFIVAAGDGHIGYRLFPTQLTSSTWDDVITGPAGLAFGGFYIMAGTTGLEHQPHSVFSQDRAFYINCFLPNGEPLFSPGDYFQAPIDLMWSDPGYLNFHFSINGANAFRFANTKQFAGGKPLALIPSPNGVEVFTEVESYLVYGDFVTARGTNFQKRPTRVGSDGSATYTGAAPWSVWQGLLWAAESGQETSREPLGVTITRIAYDARINGLIAMDSEPRLWLFDLVTGKWSLPAQDVDEYTFFWESAGRVWLVGSTYANPYRLELERRQIRTLSFKEVGFGNPLEARTLERILIHTDHFDRNTAQEAIVPFTAAVYTLEQPTPATVTIQYIAPGWWEIVPTEERSGRFWRLDLAVDFNACRAIQLPIVWEFTPRPTIR
jgi:hypothetical protein